MSKGEFRGVAGDIGVLQRKLQKDFLPQYGQLRSDIGGFRGGLESIRTAPQKDLEAARGDIGTLRNAYTGMITDESKRGYSPTALTGMRGRAADTIAGSRRSTLEDINRRTAAAGMGNTGVGIRAGMDYGRDVARQGREAQRDIDIANEEAKRSDLWNAYGGIGNVAQQQAALQQQQNAWNLGNLGLQSDTYNQQLGSLGAENQAYGNLFDTYKTQLQAYGLANQPGTWTKFGQALLGNLADAFGSGWSKGFGGG